VGAFGYVYKAKLWGTAVAVKVLKTESQDKKKSDKDKKEIEKEIATELKREIGILSQMRHPNIVLYIGACPKFPNICIVMEWCARGSLFSILHDKTVL